MSSQHQTHMTTFSVTSPSLSVVTSQPASEVAMRRSRRVVPSCFDASLMPSDAIFRRKLYSFSVHYSVATSKWISTLMRPGEATVGGSNSSSENEKRRCVSFSFQTEREARKFAKAYSPPKMMTDATKCLICKTDFTGRCSKFNCRNCGVNICDQCSTRWGIRMMPRTFLQSGTTALTIRVCKSCDWLSNAFCLALLQGNFENARKFQETGNVNLRCSFADIHKEAMFPIHCAVMGGNLQVVKWLVETHDCPISVKRDPRTGLKLSVQTSANRTLIDLAMTGKFQKKASILSYLVQRGLSVTDTKDPNLAPKTLQSMMKAGLAFHWNDRSDELEVRSVEDVTEASAATLEDVCVICCEKQMDCVLTPCGHQICCSDCGQNLSQCPICKRRCDMLRIFRL